MPVIKKKENWLKNKKRKQQEVINLVATIE
jgi:hypothetical protein